MAKNFTKDFINLSNRSLGSYHGSEFHFNHAESGLNVRPLMIMSKERIPIEVVIMPHSLPKLAIRLVSLTTLRIAFERDIRCSVYSHYSIKIAFAGISLVSRNFVNIEMS